MAFVNNPSKQLASRVLSGDSPIRSFATASPLRMRWPFRCLVRATLPTFTSS